MQKIIGIVLFFILTTTYAATLDPILKIHADKSVSLTRSQLLKMQTEEFIMSDSRAYLGKPVHYTAVRLCDLLKSYHVKSTDTVEFISTDQFYSLVPAKVVMQCNAHTAIGYVAIERSDKPWPTLTYNVPDVNQPQDGTAGPFAVLWRNPEKSYISNEYWAWKLAEITVHHKVSVHSVIAPPVTNDLHIKNGHFAYVSRCAGCHTLNGVGNAKIGPNIDASLNKSPIFRDDKTLKKFIRDPQSVRHKPNDRMSGTSEKFLSNNDLDDLVQYLRYKVSLGSKD